VSSVPSIKLFEVKRKSRLFCDFIPQNVFYAAYKYVNGCNLLEYPGISLVEMAKNTMALIRIFNCGFSRAGEVQR
jgi:hypothetical protein